MIFNISIDIIFFPYIFTDTPMNRQILWCILCKLFSLLIGIRYSVNCGVSILVPNWFLFVCGVGVACWHMKRAGTLAMISFLKRTHTHPSNIL